MRALLLVLLGTAGAAGVTEPAPRQEIVGPFGRAAGWQGYGWDLRPASPRLAGRIVFLTAAPTIAGLGSGRDEVLERALALFR